MHFELHLFEMRQPQRTAGLAHLSFTRITSALQLPQDVSLLNLLLPLVLQQPVQVLLDAFS